MKHSTSGKLFLKTALAWRGLHLCRGSTIAGCGTSPSHCRRCGCAQGQRLGSLGKGERLHDQLQLLCSGACKAQTQISALCRFRRVIVLLADWEATAQVKTVQPMQRAEVSATRAFLEHPPATGSPRARSLKSRLCYRLS